MTIRTSASARRGGAGFGCDVERKERKDEEARRLDTYGRELRVSESEMMGAWPCNRVGGGIYRGLFTFFYVVLFSDAVCYELACNGADRLRHEQKQNRWPPLLP